MQPGDVLGLLIVVGSIASVIILRGPLGRALADRLAGRAGAPDAAGQRALDVAERTAAEMDELRGRLAEIEERQDFTERVLARQSDRPRIEGER